MNQWLKIGIVVVIVIIVLVFIVWPYYQCKKNGRQMGVPYKCRMFSSAPITLKAVDEYYDMRYGKCYRFIDYGDSMSVRETDLENCN